MMPYEVVRSRNDGLFSNVYSVLGTIHWCEEHGAVPVVRFDSGPYLDAERGPNWWEYFFARVSDIDPMSLPADADGVGLTRAGEMAFRVSLYRDLAADIIRRHIRVRPDVQREVDAFWDQHLANRFVVGVHMRGTDKWLEAPTPRVDELFAALDLLLLQRPAETWRLFIATDEAGFLTRIRERYGAQVVAQDALRSENGQALHRNVSAELWKRGPFADQPPAAFTALPPYRLGLEAVCDALILARCHTFFGSQSNLSYFVGACNPQLPWIHLGGMLPVIAFREQLTLEWCGNRFDWLTEVLPSVTQLTAKEEVIRTLQRTAEERGRLIQTLHDAGQEKEQIIRGLKHAADERLQLVETLSRRVRELEQEDRTGQEASAIASSPDTATPRRAVQG